MASFRPDPKICWNEVWREQVGEVFKLVRAAAGQAVLWGSIGIYQWIAGWPTEGLAQE